MQQMKHATDGLITPAAAAKALGLNRSTLSRQIQRGAIRTHNGLVRIEEVIEDRRRNVYTARGAGRTLSSGSLPRATLSALGKSRGNAPASGDVARAPSDLPPGLAIIETLADPFDEGAVMMGLELVYRIARLTATTAVEAGSSCKVAHALGEQMIDVLMTEVVTIGVENMVEPFATDRTADVLEVEAIQIPDWDALTKATGEAYNLEAWWAYQKKRFKP